MSGLDSKIRPGDALSVTALQANFDSFETDIAAVTGAMTEDRTIDTLHADSKVRWRDIEQATGGAVAAGYSANTVLCTITNHDCVVGEPVYVNAVIRLTATATTGNMQFAIKDSVSGTLVARTHTLVIGTGLVAYAVLNMVWAFVATSTTHTLTAEAVSSSANMAVVSSALTVESIRR
jgi:hypothetical protein